MRLALHRSITFWSGLFVMLFLAWAWRDSMASRSWASIARLTVANSPGYFSLFHSKDPRAPGPALKIERDSHSPRDQAGIRAITAPRFVPGGDGEFQLVEMDQQESYQDLVTRLMDSRPAGDWMLMIPHWLVLSLAGALWIALLLWRAQRRRKGGRPGA